MQSALSAVVGWGNAAVGTFQGAYDAITAIWGALPQAIGDFAFQAANGLIDGVEAMLNAVVTRINSFIEGLNAALALLPDWATGEGGIRIGTLEAVDLGGIANPYEGAAADAGTAAAEAFKAAMAKIIRRCAGSLWRHGRGRALPGGRICGGRGHVVRGGVAPDDGLGSPEGCDLRHRHGERRGAERCNRCRRRAIGRV